jgi:hypothetical protein
MTRAVCQVGAEAVGRRQTRPLADQDENESRAEPVCNLVAKRYARTFGDDNRRERQTYIQELGDQPRQKGDSIVGYRLRGKAIRDDDRDIEIITSQLVETLGALDLKTPPQIWPAQIEVAPRRWGLDPRERCSPGPSVR